MAIDRDEIAEIVYSGMATPSNNTVRPTSPLFREDYRTKYAKHDRAGANRLLDEIGLKRRDGAGIRLLGDNQPATIVIETAGETTEESDVLRLVIDHWKRVGLRTVVKPQTRENLRLRVFGGAAIMSVWPGIENANPRPESSPRELAPTSLGDLQWSKWGQFYESGGQSGERCDMPEANRLLDLLRQWERATDTDTKARAWHAMLELHADQQFSIGIVSGVQQPVVVRNRLRNVPKKGIYAWLPSAFFGVYRPDLFWIDE
jgi:peptide/nickel transport system substrate-binding protein